MGELSPYIPFTSSQAPYAFQDFSQKKRRKKNGQARF